MKKNLVGTKRLSGFVQILMVLDFYFLKIGVIANNPRKNSSEKNCESCRLLLASRKCQVSRGQVSLVFVTGASAYQPDFHLYLFYVFIIFYMF